VTKELIEYGTYSNGKSWIMLGQDVLRIVNRAADNFDRYVRLFERSQHTLETISKTLIELVEVQKTMEEQDRVELDPSGIPPMCPHCGTPNPEVTLIQNEEMQGPLGDCVLAFQPRCCGKKFYVAMESFPAFKDLNVLHDYMMQGVNDGNE
jgi:hypothetical protein